MTFEYDVPHPPGTNTPEFHRKQFFAERAGWFGMALLIGWALMGGFGNGLLSDQRLANDDGNLSIEYQKFARRDAPMEMRLTTATSAPDSELRLHFSREFVEGIQIGQFAPMPTAMKLDSEGIQVTFSIKPDDKPCRIQWEYKPKNIGLLHGNVQVNDQSALSFEQFVYP
jgi:hypothetical protein